jgi:hypothetical protein
MIVLILTAYIGKIKWFSKWHRYPLRAYADGIAITGSNLGTTYKVNAGSDTGTGKAGVDLSIVSRYGTITANAFKICDGAGNNCGQSPGGLTVQSTRKMRHCILLQRWFV